MIITEVVFPVIAVLLGGCAARDQDLCKGASAYVDEDKTFASLLESNFSIDDGETLHVCPGVHDGSEWMPYNVDYSEGYARAASYALVGAGAEHTTIDGSDWSFLWLFPADDLTVADITFANGRARPTEPCVDGDYCSGPSFSGTTSVWDGHALFDHVVFESNEADYGGALGVGGGTEDAVTVFPTVTLRDSVFRSNSALAGGATILDGPGVLISENTDWGSGDTDNVPDDIVFIAHRDDDDDDVVVEASYSFDGPASFTCDWDTRTCE